MPLLGSEAYSVYSLITILAKIIIFQYKNTHLKAFLRPGYVYFFRLGFAMQPRLISNLTTLVSGS